MELQEAHDIAKKGKLVKFNDIKYTIDAIIYQYIKPKGRWEYCLRLKDLRTNSVIIADMKKVEVVG